MANDNTAPLEGAEAPGFFSHGWTLDKGLEWMESLFKWGAKVIKNTAVKVATWEFDFTPNLLDEDLKKYWVAEKKLFTIDDQDKIVEERKAIWSWQMLKDIAAPLKDLGLKPWNFFWKDAVIAPESKLKGRLNEWISEDIFNKKLEEYKASINDARKRASDITSADPRYAEYRDFEQSSYLNYLKARGIDSVTDAKDYESFQRQEMAKLNALEQQNIINQINELQQVTGKYEQEASLKQEELNQYLNASIKWEGEKTGQQIFEDIEKDSEDKFKKNKTLQNNGKIFQIVDNKITEEFEKDGRSISWLWASYLKLKDAIVESIAASETYKIDILWMDIPNAKEYAEAWDTTSQVDYKFRLKFARLLADAKDDPKNKWVDELELRKKINSQVFKESSAEDRRLMQIREEFPTRFSIKVNADEAVSRTMSWNPQSVLDIFSVVSSTFQDYVDQAFRTSWDEVPHYFNQEMRSLIYSDEANYKKAASMLTYNFDALLSMPLPIKWAGLVTKPMEKIINTLTSKKVDAFLKIPTKVWFDTGYLRIVPNTAKGLMNSLATGAAWDPIFDNLMIQAPTAAIEWFNNYTNVFFDGAMFTGWKWLAYGVEGTKNMNGLMYKFIYWDEAAAIKDWTNAFNDNYNKGKKITVDEWKEILDHWRQLYSNIYSPEEIKKTFNEKGGIYRYLSDNISQMTPNWIKEILTGNGLWIKIEDIVGIPRTEIDTLNGLFDVHSRITGDDAKNKLVSSRIEQKLNAIEAFTKWAAYDWSIIQKKFLNISPELAVSGKNPNTEIALIQNRIKAIRENMKKPDSLEANKILIWEIDESIRILRENFTARRTKTEISLSSPGSPNVIKIWVDDLLELSWKTFSDLVNDQKVTIEKQWRYKWQIVEPWIYDILMNKSSVFDDYISNFVKTIDTDINDFKLANWLAQDDNIKQNIINLLTNGRVDFGYLAKYSWIEWTNQRKNLIEFVQEKLKSFYGEWFLNDKAHFISNVLVPGEEILESFKSNDGYINISYWSFFTGKDGSSKSERQVNMVYTSWGKELNQDEIFEKRLAEKIKYNTDGSLDMKYVSIYSAKTNEMTKTIMKYAIQKDGTVDFLKGVQKAREIEAVGDIENLFEWDKLSRTLVARIVNKAILNEWIDSFTSKGLIDLVMWVFSHLWKDDWALLKPMIYSLIWKYIKNKPLIDELFKRTKNQDFVKAFANILISPDSYADMAKKLSSRVEQPTVSKNFALAHDAAWTQYSNRLKWLITKLDFEIDAAKELKKISWNYTVRDMAEEKLTVLENKKRSIKKMLDKEVEYKDNLMERDLMNVNMKYLEDLTQDYSFATLLQTDKSIVQWNLEQRIKDHKSMRSQLKDLYSDNAPIFDEVLDDFKKVSEWTATMEDRKALLDKYKDRNYSSEIVKDTVDKMIESFMHPTDKSLSLYDHTVVEEIMKNKEGLLNPVFAKENNPFVKAISAWLNNSNSGRDDILEKKISEYFLKWKNITEYKGLKIEYRDDIVNRAWELWAMQINTKTNTISINEKLLQEKFDNKAWTKPYKQSDWSYATALKDDAFKTYDEFKSFLLEHEYQHTLIKIKEWQTRWEYEDIINAAALFEVDYKNTKAVSADELYHMKDIDGKPNEFKEIVDGLFAKESKSGGLDRTAINGWLMKYEDFLQELFKWMPVNTEAWDMSEELLKDLLRDRKVINRFKSLANRDLSKTAINLKVVEDPITQESYFVHTKDIYNENIFQIDNMRKSFDEKSKWWVIELFGFSQKQAWFVIINPATENSKARSLYSVYNEYILEQYASNPTNPKLAYASKVEQFSILTRIINNTLTDEDRIILWGFNRKDILEQLWIPDGYVITWNFGDKDSVYTLYKSGLDIYDKPKVSTNIDIDDNLPTIESLQNQIRVLENEFIDVDNSKVIEDIQKEIDILRNTQNNKQKFLLFTKDWKDYYTNDGQTEWIIKIREYLNGSSEDPFILVWPGWTGKTAVIWKALEWSYKKVIFLWPTNKSKKALQQANEKSWIVNWEYSTIDSFLWNKLWFDEWKNKLTVSAEKQILDDTIFVVDEVSMFWNNKEKWQDLWKYDSFLETVNKWSGNKIIFMGDSLQAPPIGEKIAKAFSSWYDWHVLTETMRQDKDSPIVAITNQYRKNLKSTNKIINPVGNSLRNDVSIDWSEVLFMDRKKATEAIAEKMKPQVLAWQIPEYRYLSFRNAYKFEINPNSVIRKIIFWEDAKNVLNQWETLVTYKPISKKSEDGETSINLYTASDDMLISNYLWSKKTTLWSSNITIDIHTIIDNNGEELEIVFKKDFDNADSKIRELAKDKWKFNWNLLKPEDKIALRFLNDQSVIDYWYAMTTHKSQWSTYKWVVVDEDDILYRWYKDPSMSDDDNIDFKNKLLYVATSRPTNSLIIIWNKKVDNTIDGFTFNENAVSEDIINTKVDIAIDWNNEALIREKENKIQELQVTKIRKDNSAEIAKLKEIEKSINDSIVEDITTDWILPGDKAEIEQSIYKYQYAYANGYIKSKEFKTWEAFRDKFFTGQNFSSFEKYAEYMENIETGVYKKNDEWNLENLHILPRDQIRKRESFNMSRNSTFDKFDIPINTYVLEEDIEEIELLSHLKDNKGNFNGTQEQFDALIQNNPDDKIAQFIQETLKKYDVNKLNELLNRTYNNDLQDGTSFISQGLAKIRAEIQSWMLWSDEYPSQFKDHFYGEIDWRRIWWKTLFNSSNISWLKWNNRKAENTVLLGESSMKLKWGYKKFTKDTEWVDSYTKKNGEVVYYKTIYIDGKERRILGEIEWARTSFFKDAESEKFTDHSELSVSDSIKWRIPKQYSDLIEAIQIEDINKAYEDVRSILWEYSIAINSYGDVVKLIEKISSDVKLWMWADAIVKWKLSEFMTVVDRIINKPKDPGQSMYIRQSDINIGMDEVIMSKNSDFVILAQKEIEDSFFEKYNVKTVDELPDDARMEMNRQKKEEVYTVGYRYPVPSMYNLGVYKVLFQEDLDQDMFGHYRNMGKRQVVTHPFATYMKLEWDNDGDHVFFLSARGKMGKILTSAVLDDPKIDPLKAILDRKNNNEPLNKFIIADAVEKSTWIDGETKVILDDNWNPKKIPLSLYNSRLIALEAKSSIDIVSAALRTIGTLRQMFSVNIYDDFPISYKEMPTINEKTGKVYSADTTKTIKELRQKYFKNIDQIDSDTRFDEIAASILQTTLDFGNSWKTEFNKDWYVPLLRAAWIEEDKIVEVYYSVISPLSKGYNGSDIKKSYPLWLATVSDKYEKDLLFWVTGSKRNIYEYLLKNTSYRDKSIADFVLALNSTHDLHFVVNNLVAQTKNKNLKEIINFMNGVNKSNKANIPNFKELGYIMADYRKVLNDFILNLDHSDEMKNKMILIKDFHEAKKNYKERTAIGEKLFESIKTLDKDDRMILALTSASYGETNLFNYFTITEKLNYLEASDQTFLDGVAKNYAIAMPKSALDYNTFKQEITQNIEDLKKELKWTSDEWAIDAIEHSLEKQQSALSDIDTLINNLKENEDKVIDPIYEEVTVPTVWEVSYPEFSFNEVDTSPQAINEITSEFARIDSLARDWWKTTTQWMFNKYSPRLLGIYNTINDLLNSKNKVLANASDEHVRQFWRRFFGDPNSIYRQLEKAWVSKEKMAKLSLGIERSLIGNAGGVFHSIDEPIIIKNITPILEEYGVGHLVNDSNFTNKLFTYNKNVITVAINKLNQVQEALRIDISNSYKNLNFSILNDLFEAHKGDPAFALKLFWLKDRDAFIAHIRESAAEMWEKILEGTIRTMTNTVYKNHSGMDWVLNFVKWIHYEMTYGTLSTLVTQNSIIAGLSQILPNYVELRSYIGKNADVLRDGLYIMWKYNLLDSEDVIQNGTWLWKNMNNTFMWWVIQKATKDLALGVFNIPWKVMSGIKKEEFIATNRAIRASQFVDSVMNNMLGFNDWPLENLRKIVATHKTMEKFWFKTAKDLENAIDNGGLDFEMVFRTHVRNEFANSWGWVVSSSPIASWTIFENSYEYLHTWIVPLDFITEFWVKSLSYLMWWSFHKAAVLIEKESALLTGMKKLVWNRDKFAAAAHFTDWITYNTMLGRQVALTLGLYLKFQKYEKDNEDRLTFWSFAKQFANAWVSVSIPLQRHFSAYETASDLWEWSDASLYTINSLFKHMTRLFKQGLFLSTMYEKYKTDEALWQEDAFNALQFAMNVHYASYMRYTWMEVQNDHYRTLTQQSNLGILWVGGNTLEDDLASQLLAWSTFTSWKDKWFIASLLNISSFIKTTDTDVGMSVAQDLARQLRDRVVQDPQLSKLLKWWQIGKWIQDYNMSNLLGSNKILTTEEEGIVSDLWKEIWYYTYRNVDKDGKVKVYSNWKLIPTSKDQQFLEERITKEFAKKGVNISDVIAANPEYDPAFTKTLMVLDMDSELKVPLVIATIMEMERKRITEDMKDKEWVLTGQRSPYNWKWYKTLTQEQEIRVQRDILLKYQEYFNLDNNLVQNIIEKHIAKNNVELFDKFENISNLKFIKNDVYDLVKRDYLARNVMNNGDTKVASLQSRYALAYKWIKSTETGAKLILSHLNAIENLPAMDAKTKLANQAAAIMSLNTTQYGLLKNNKEFAKLTEDSQKQITNWLYKISSASMDYDSSSLKDELNQASWFRKATKGYSSILPKWKSSSFWWQRPNFSNQFSPIRDFLPGKERYISSDPNRYLKSQDFMPRTQLFNPWQFPIVQEYIKIAISNIYYGYESKGTIRTGSTDKKFDKNQNTNIKIAKPKKAKSTKEFKKFKPTPKVSMWMRPDLPLANYWD